MAATTSLVNFTCCVKMENGALLRRSMAAASVQDMLTSMAELLHVNSYKDIDDIELLQEVGPKEYIIAFRQEGGVVSIDKRDGAITQLSVKRTSEALPQEPQVSFPFHSRGVAL